MAWTLETAKAKLGIPSGDTTQDAQITAEMAAAVSLAENYCQRGILEKTDIVEDAYRNHSSTYQLWRYPVAALTSIVAGGSNGGDIDVGSITVDMPRGTILLDSQTYFGHLVVTYDAGYANTDLPPDLELGLWMLFSAVHSLNAAMFTTLDSAPITSVTIPDVGTIRYDTNHSNTGSSDKPLTDQYAMAYGVLDPYVRARC